MTANMHPRQHVAHRPPSELICTRKLVERKNKLTSRALVSRETVSCQPLPYATSLYGVHLRGYSVQQAVEIRHSELLVPNTADHYLHDRLHVVAHLRLLLDRRSELFALLPVDGNIELRAAVATDVEVDERRSVEDDAQLTEVADVSRILDGNEALE